MTLGFPAAQDSPLSLQGEGWGEGRASIRNTGVAGKPPSRASSLLHGYEAPWLQVSRQMRSLCDYNGRPCVYRR